MSIRDKSLNIIITNSFQNDFIEPLDDLLRTPEGDGLRLDYDACQKKWCRPSRKMLRGARCLPDSRWEKTGHPHNQSSGHTPFQPG